MSWTEERVDVLKKLWMEGLSASQIAGELGEGVTRNAVIGKVHRLKLSGRAKPASSVSRARTANRTPRRSGRSGQGAIKQRGVSAPVNGATALAMNADTQLEALAAPRVDELFIPLDKRIGLMELSEQTCKWPIGDPMLDDFHFCGGASEDNRPYCTFHSAKAYHTVERKKR